MLFIFYTALAAWQGTTNNLRRLRRVFGKEMNRGKGQTKVIAYSLLQGSTYQLIFIPNTHKKK